MTQREARLSRDIRKSLDTAFGPDIFLFKVWGNEHQMAGLPDLLGCYKGIYFGIETKLPESRDNVSPRQALVHRMIRDAGGKVAICTTRQEAMRFIESLSDLEVGPAY